MLFASSLVGCGSPGGPADTPSKPVIRELPNGMVVQRRIGTIEFHGTPASINAPDSVQRGQEFVVEVSTFGSECIGKGDMEAQASGLSVVLTPYDWEVVRLPPNTACRVAVRPNEHAATSASISPARVVLPFAVSASLRARSLLSSMVSTSAEGNSAQRVCGPQ